MASKNLELKMEDLRKQLKQKDEAIKTVLDKKNKEEELIEIHKSRAKKFEEVFKKIDSDKNVIRLKMLDAAADISNTDRNQFFEKMLSSVAGQPPFEKEKKESSKSAEQTSPEKKESSKSAEQSNPEKSESQKTAGPSPSGKETPLDKARAEFLKKHPEGFAAVASSKKE